MHKDRLGKLKAGPVWDFDYLTFVSHNAYAAQRHIYYARLLTDPSFVALVKERWNSLKPAFQTIPEYIRTKAETIRTSNDINIRLWPITLTTNGDEALSFDEAIDRMVKTYEDRLECLESKINAM